jgi:Ca-activated chloride channel family protein
MKCTNVQERLTDHLLDEIPAPDRRTVDAHLAECAACAGEAEKLRVTMALLREHAPAAPPSLRPEQREAIEQAAMRPRRDWRLFAAAASLILVGGLAFLVGQRMRSPVRTVDSASAIRTPPPLPRTAPPAMKSLNDLFPVETVQGKKQLEQAQLAAEAQARREKMAELKALGYVSSDYDKRREILVGHSGAVSGRTPSNAADARDMYFEHAGTNPFLPADEQRLSTFGLDVDTASYMVARNYLLRGALPPPAAVRVEEFVNAFAQPYAADPEKTFAIDLAGAPNPFHPGYELLRIGLKAREVEAHERKPAVLTFVIDVSGSMGLENRLGLVKRSLRLLVEKLDERDAIGIVVYGTTGHDVLETTSAHRRERILDAVERLNPEGSTNLEDGLSLGYAMAARHFRKDASNRVVLCTDGVANNGVTDPEKLLRQIDAKARHGIDLMALGFGMGNYNDVLLQKLADQGNGQYAYIDDFDEARAFFLRDLTSVLQVVARDAKAQVEWNPERVERYRLLGYEKRDVADRDFRNDAVHGGTVNSGHTVTVLYEVKLKPGEGDLGTVHLRYADADTRRTAEDSTSIGSGVFAPSFGAAPADLQLSAVVARFAEHLRKSYWAKDEPLRAVLAEAEALPDGVRDVPANAELISLIRTAVRLQAAE